MAIVAKCDKCGEVAEDMHVVQIGYGMTKTGMAQMGGAHICKECWPQWKANLDPIIEFFRMESQQQSGVVGVGMPPPPDILRSN